MPKQVARRSKTRAHEPITEPPSETEQRMLQQGAFREYLCYRLAERFSRLVEAFLDAAETGSAVHMKMIVSLLEATPQGATDSSEQDLVRGLLQEWRERHPGESIGPTANL